MDREQTSLDDTELRRLGQFVWEALLRLGDRYLPPQVEEDEYFPHVWAEAPDDFLPLGWHVYDWYIHRGEKRDHPTFLEGKLFWQALTEAIAFLLDERKNRIVVIDGDGAHPEPAPPPRTIPLEYLARYIIVSPFAANVQAASLRREQEARIHFSLALDPFCTEAYHAQGELDERGGAFHRARIAYERALRIATLLVGPDTLARAVASEAKIANFWVASDNTRAYMRSRASLARLIWSRLHDPTGAIAHFNELLHLDPVDHQDNRHALMCCLLETGDVEALGALLARYRLSTFTHSETTQPVSEDVTDTWWQYTHACRLFQIASSSGNHEAGLHEAIQALYHAFRANGYVPLLLLNSAQRISQDISLDPSPGSLEEAVRYVDMALSAWSNTPGALQWLEATWQSLQ